MEARARVEGGAQGKTGGFVPVMGAVVFMVITALAEPNSITVCQSMHISIWHPDPPTDTGVMLPPHKSNH